MGMDASSAIGSTAHSRLDGGDVDLLHRHHRLERTFSRVAALGECIGQHTRGDLPADAPFVLAPAALAFLPAITDDRVPVAVGLFLTFGGDLEGKGLAMLELWAAIEADTGYARDGELDSQGIARFAVGIVARRTVDGAEAAVREGFGVEAPQTLPLPLLRGSAHHHPTTRLVYAKSPFTKAYERHLLLTLIHGTISDVCQKERALRPDALLGVVDRWLEAAVDWSALPAFSVLGLDEIALKKSHRDYVVVVIAQCPDGTLHLLGMLPDRTKATVRTCLASMPSAVRRGIRTVCLDMWEAYVNAVEEVLPTQPS